MGSETTHTRLNNNACCDGSGIVAQARLFGYHSSDLSTQDWECEEVDSQPCTECGIQVCDVCIVPMCYDHLASEYRTNADALQNCRFHCAYFPFGGEKFVNAVGVNPAYMIPLDSYEAEADHVGCVAWQASGGGSFHFDATIFPAVELRKAWDIFHHRRFLGKCKDCAAQPSDNLVSQNDDGCHCELWSYFVARRWLCIPCLLIEETEAYKGIRWTDVVGPLAVQVSLLLPSPMMRLV